jgi:hypothetical protein
MNMTNAGAIAAELRKLKSKFCEPCLIVLSGCNVGNMKTGRDTPAILAEVTGCSVLAAGGFAKGALASSVTVTAKDGGSGPTLYEYFKGNPKNAPATLMALKAAIEDSADDRYYFIEKK